MSPKTLIARTVAVLITIITATVAIIVTTNRSNSQDARRAAQVQVDSIDAACDAYYVAVNKYPSSLDDLFGNPGDSDWKGPGFSNHSPLVDPWGQAIRYDPNGPRHKSARPDIWSAGP